MKNLGLNTIRLEGHLMPQDWYNQMDAAGILINAGFQCCDAWELQSSGLTSTADYAIMTNSAVAIAQNLRNHPSVFSFQWSDEPPLATQETDTLNAFSQQDFTDPVISSAEYKSSPTLGISGEKEGPYDWVPPNYWYDTTHFDSRDSTQTNAGGSWGYDSEQSAGDTIPTMDSLNRFMSSSDLSNLWQSSTFNQYHANYEPTCNTNYNFGTLCHFDAALDARYGTPTSLARYVEEAQAQNYENTRAQYEAFIDHANNTPMPSTGTIYWQMNKGWPSLLWYLWNYDGDQAGSYFGAQEANRHAARAVRARQRHRHPGQPVQHAPSPGCRSSRRSTTSPGPSLDDQTASNITLSGQQVRTNVLTPKVPTTPAGTTYFVELQLKQNGTLVDRNVYWLSTTQDVDELEEGPRQAGRRDLHLREPHRPGVAAGSPAISATATHDAAGRPGRRRPGHHRHDHQHLIGHGRVPAPGRRPAGYRQRRAAVRRQRTPVLDLAEQRHHAVPRRVADADGHLRLVRPAAPTRRSSRCPAGTSPQVNIPAPVP